MSEQYIICKIVLQLTIITKQNVCNIRWANVRWAKVLWANVRWANVRWADVLAPDMQPVVDSTSNVEQDNSEIIQNELFGVKYLHKIFFIIIH